MQSIKSTFDCLGCLLHFAANVVCNKEASMLPASLRFQVSVYRWVCIHDAGLIIPLTNPLRLIFDQYLPVGYLIVCLFFLLTGRVFVPKTSQSLPTTFFWRFQRLPTSCSHVSSTNTKFIHSQSLRSLKDPQFTTSFIYHVPHPTPTPPRGFAEIQFGPTQQISAELIMPTQLHFGLWGGTRLVQLPA
eukprot:EG_transcript_32763